LTNEASVLDVGLPTPFELGALMEQGTFFGTLDWFTATLAYRSNHLDDDKPCLRNGIPFHYDQEF
jgi:hypothetical protein